MVQMDDRWLWLPGLGRFVFLDDDALAKLTAAAFRQPVLEVAL